MDKESNSAEISNQNDEKQVNKDEPKAEEKAENSDQSQAKNHTKRRTFKRLLANGFNAEIKRDKMKNENRVFKVKLTKEGEQPVFQWVSEDKIIKMRKDLLDEYNSKPPKKSHSTHHHKNKENKHDKNNDQQKKAKGDGNESTQPEMKDRKLIKIIGLVKGRDPSKPAFLCKFADSKEYEKVSWMIMHRYFKQKLLHYYEKNLTFNEEVLKETPDKRNISNKLFALTVTDF